MLIPAPDDRVGLSLGGGKHDAGAQHIPIRGPRLNRPGGLDGFVGGGQVDCEGRRHHHRNLFFHPGASAPRSHAVPPPRVGQDGGHGENSRVHERLRTEPPGHPRQGTLATKRINTRYRTGFAYVDALLASGQTLKLCRLRYTAHANEWGFAIYRASHDDNENSFLPTGLPHGPVEAALDTSCGLYLADPTAWN